MKYKNFLVIFLFSLSFLIGCVNMSKPTSINQTTEVLDEGLFRFRYPTDWHITMEEHVDKNDQKNVTYRFRHPQTKECYVTIEKIKYLKKTQQINPLNEIIADETRDFKEAFEKTGYRDFSFRTSHVTFADNDAIKLTLEASKFSTTRKAVLRILLYKYDYYVIAYQTYDSWNEKILNRLEEIVGSFQFVK